MLSAHSAVAQTTLSPIDSLPLRDLTGFSTQNIIGPRFEIDLPDGTQCVSVHGTPPTLNFYSGLSEREDEVSQDSTLVQKYFGVGSGFAVGASITIPLFNENARNCDAAYAISILNKKIELATLLNNEGFLSDDDLQALLQEARKILLNTE